MGVCAFDEKFDAVRRADNTELLELTHQLTGTFPVLRFAAFVVTRGGVKR